MSHVDVFPLCDTLLAGIFATLATFAKVESKTIQIWWNFEETPRYEERERRSFNGGRVREGERESGRETKREGER